MNELYYLPVPEDCAGIDRDALLRWVSPRRSGSSSRTESLLAEALVRRLACAYGNLDNKALRIGRNAYGKPFIANLPDFRFSISHTQGAVLIGVSPREIGVDVERRRDIRLRIAQRFFAPGEQDYVFSASDGQPQRFFEIWTRKEAYIKWLGKGLAVPLTSFDTLSAGLDAKISTFCRGEHTISVCGDEPVCRYSFAALEWRELRERIDPLGEAADYLTDQ